MANRPIVSTLHTGFTSLGTSTAKTQLGGAAVILPAWARSIWAVVPQVVIDDPTAAEAVIASCAVESNDVSLTPFEVMPAPGTSFVGSATTGVFHARNETFGMGVPVNGGEQISVYETALVANTAAPIGSATLVVSNMHPGHPQRHAKIGTLTSTGTTASSDVAGTRYNFSGGTHIIELYGAIVQTTRTSNEGITGYVKYTSSEFDGVSDVRLPLNPIGGGLGTNDAGLVDGVSRQKVDIPLAPGRGQVNIQDYLFMGLAPGTAGNFVDGVIYE